MNIRFNIENLEKSISEICKNCGRDENDIRLIAVSKTKSVPEMREAMENDIKDFGENYIQEALEKYESLKDEGVRFHFIGALQTNKVKDLLKFCSLLHSLDREGLVKELQKRLESEGRTLDALIQINTSGETTKSGIEPSRFIEFAKFVSTHDRIKIKGLMTIAENSCDEKSIRDNYKQLKNLFEEVKVLHLPNFDMKELSMGMSGDYKIAIEEGATMVRIGSSIFGERVYGSKEKKGEKPAPVIKPNALERFIYNNTPQSVKNWINRMIDKLPPKTGNWIRNNKFITICIVYAIRGLFFRPTMWAVYAGIAAYFGLK